MSWIDTDEGTTLDDIDILTYDDGVSFEIIMDSNGNVLLGDFL